MIPRMNIVAWGNFVPWVEQRQVEQDLIISRTLIELFSDARLSRQLRIRGGTALNKLHFPEPYRYSEDIDLVRTEAGPIGPVLDTIRSVLEPWLGHAKYYRSPVAPKLIFRVDAEGPDVLAPIRLKIEINTREIEAFDPPRSVPYKVYNPWFNGAALIPTFSPEEMLATKLRAFLQRNKSRDLFDLDYGLRTFEGLKNARIIECFTCYLKASGMRISRAMAQQQLFARMAHPDFLGDIRPLVPAEFAQSLNEVKMKATFKRVLLELISLIPGDDWIQTPDMIERFAL